MSANVETSGFVGRVLGGRWVVGEQLGTGTFGVVHAGVERGTGQPVAIKLLHPQFLHHGETIARFWNEAEALRRLDHPNVLVLLDVGVAEDGVPYLVTELLTGETLRDLLNREGALPPERAMRLLGPAAHALHHAHMAGIVHRDLKPENIFRVRKDGMGTTKILDFGMAKLLDTGPGRKLSQTGVLIGTMAYSPPEQMQGVADIDHRADQFGFAALIFEALTGQRPFPQVQPFALFQAIVSGPRPRATDLRPDLPKAVDDVLIRALDPDREQRFANVEEFYLALSGALSGQPLASTFHSMQRPPVTVPPPKQPVLPPKREARYEPIADEATRGDHQAVSSQPKNPLTSTLQSGSPLDMRQGNIGTTLMEGRPPSVRPASLPTSSGSQSAPSTMQTGAPPSMESPRPPPSSVSPPASFERAISRPEPSVQPAPAPQPPAVAQPAEPAGRAFPTWIVVVAMGVILAIVAVLALTRH